MALLAVITAVVGIISTLIIAIGAGINLPAGLLTAAQYGLTLISGGMSLLYLLLPADFWHFCGSAFSVLVAAHAGYFAYSAGLSIWRIFQGGGD